MCPLTNFFESKQISVRKFSAAEFAQKNVGLNPKVNRLEELPRLKAKNNHASYLKL